MFTEDKNTYKKEIRILDAGGPISHADVDYLTKDVGFKPATPIGAGSKKFVDWYSDYYRKGEVT